MAYEEAVASGRYERTSGLYGKYDHVRIFWEDWSIAQFLAPYVEGLLARTGGSGLRVLDLGCGSGDGYELLQRLVPTRQRWSDNHGKLLDDQKLGYYKGVDLNTQLLERGRQQFGQPGRVEFCPGDFCQGLPVAEGEEGYDLYFTSYGVLSHCNDRELEILLADIARHARPGAVILADWLGRYSYEWQELWPAQEPTIDYVISYLGPDCGRDPKSLTSFPLRLMTRTEVEAVIERVRRQTGIDLRVEAYRDRSIFVGRHMETGHYNPFARPLRRAVNQLLDPGGRTDLDSLRFAYHPLPGFEPQNQFLAAMAQEWNALVEATARLLEALDRGRLSTLELPAGHLVESLRCAASAATALEPDARAWLVERQLALALRRLEMEGQRGQGLGHGFLAIITVVK